jgi:hypothetical protein
MTPRTQIEQYQRRRFLSQDEKEYYDRLIRIATSAVYCCFTFKKKPVNCEAAFADLRSMVRLWSRYCRDNIAWIAALEQTLSGCSNFSVRLHLHCILLSNAPLSPSGIQESWKRYCGNSKCEKYERAQDGIGYILKMTRHDQCEWDVSKNLYLLDLLRPDKNSRERRTHARQHERGRLRRAAGKETLEL